MLIKSKNAIDGSDIASSEITQPRHYYSRREFCALSGQISLGTAIGGSLIGAGLGFSNEATAAALVGSKSPFSIDEKLTRQKDVTGYNNFYEFGTDKLDPAAKSGSLKTAPWSVVIDGAVAKPLTLGIEDIMKLGLLEERIYRMRCVEGWSMVIPWTGLPLAKLLARVQPTSKAKFVAFTTLADPKQMPAIADRVLDYPYTEGLRMDEAMNPLSLLAMGIFGETLPNQNGAPIRLVVPWKYGFKGIKSIVKITLVEKEPPTSWNRYAPREYGFYSNVNPAVDHPRWSQKTERRIGEFSRRDTMLYNGYAEQVASLYTGMDLMKNF